MVIIGIVGKPGSGKEEFAAHLSKIWGFQIEKLPFYDYKKLRNFDKGKIINSKGELKEIKDKNEDVNGIQNEKKSENTKFAENFEINLMILEQFFQENQGESEKAMIICKKQLLFYNKNIVIFPITSMEQVKFMRKRNYFHLVFVDTPLKKRYENFCKKYDKNITLNSFIELDDFLYTKTQITDCIEQNNFRLKNFSNLEFLHNLIEISRSSIERPFRPDWDTYFMKIAYAVKARSNCMKRSVGAVIMQKKRIISTGYNGTPALSKNCYENGCNRCNSNAKQGIDLHKCICIHAEESAILETKLNLLLGATIYTTLFPCSFCAKIIKHTKIKRVVYDEEFDDKNSLKLLKEGGIEICKLESNKYLFNI